MKKNIPPGFMRQIKLFLLPGITIAVILVLTSYFLMPKINETQEVFFYFDQEKKQLAAVSKKAQKLKDLQSSTLISDFNKLTLILPSEKDVARIFSSLEQLEFENGVVIEGLGLSPGKLDDTQDSQGQPTSGVGTLTFNMAVSGPQEAILTFLDKLQNSAPFFKIDTIGVTTTRGTITATLGLSTFYQGLPQSLGKVDSPLPELSASQKKTLELAINFSVLEGLPLELANELGSPSAKPTLKKGIF